MSDPKICKKKIICLKCVLEPIELKRYIQKKNYFVNNEKLGVGT